MLPWILLKSWFRQKFVGLTNNIVLDATQLFLINPLAHVVAFSQQTVFKLLLKREIIDCRTIPCHRFHNTKHYNYGEQFVLFVIVPTNLYILTHKYIH